MVRVTVAIINSATDVLSHAETLIYIAKTLVVVVVSSIQVVVQSEVLECLCGLSTVLMLSSHYN